jgi:hypothetical protein
LAPRNRQRCGVQALPSISKYVAYAKIQEGADLKEISPLDRYRMKRDTKKVENMRAAVSLHFAHYNFVRLHRTLRTTPATAAGVDARLWSLEELVMRRQVLALHKAGRDVSLVGAPAMTVRPERTTRGGL